MSRAVVLVDSTGYRCLYLTSVTPAEGHPRLGFVENGAWSWELCKGEELAKAYHGVIVNRWPARDYKVVEVGEDWRGDYNAVIARACTEVALER